MTALIYRPDEYDGWVLSYEVKVDRIRCRAEDGSAGLGVVRMNEYDTVMSTDLSEGVTTRRLKVEGGYLYVTAVSKVSMNGTRVAVAQTFVPDPLTLSETSLFKKVFGRDV